MSYVGLVLRVNDKCLVETDLLDSNDGGAALKTKELLM